MSLSNNYIDVHVYDGALLIPPLISYTESEKCEQIQRLQIKLTNSNAIAMIKLIESCIINKTQENYDVANKVDASDLLANILSEKYDDIIDILEEQLEDVFLLGQCPQGRTTRLLQILCSIKN